MNLFFFKKKILFIFTTLNFLLINEISNTKNNYQILSIVNNEAITFLDLTNEIEVIKIINNTKDINEINLENIALQTLIEEKIKKQEITKQNIKISKKNIENYYITLLNKNKIDKETINSNIQDLIREKILLEFSWNELIIKKFKWKISINMNEINQKTLNSNSIEKNKKNQDYLNTQKENLINAERNKKLSVYSRYYLNKIKNQSLIKIYK